MRPTPMLLAAALAASACSTAMVLTDRGSAVAEITHAEIPEGCNMLGDVAVGVPPDAARPGTEAELHVLLRNKAGERGATHVIVEMSEHRDEGGGRGRWVGRGLAYHCPPPPPPE